MSNGTELDIARELEAFLYTPYGVSTLAALAIVLTSAAWGIGCCLCYCCYRRRHRNQDGTLEASREMEYFGMLSSAASSRNHLGGSHNTMSSGYNTGPGPVTYSLSHTGNNTVTSSLDSIIDH